MYNFPHLQKLSQVEGMVKALREKPRFYALDFETTGLNPYQDKIVGASFSWNDVGAVYVPIKHRYDQPFDGMDAVEILRPLLADYVFGAFNAVFELEFLELDWGIVPNSQPVDVSLLTYIQGKYEFQKLETICKEEFPELGVISYDEFMGGVNLRKKNTIDEAIIHLVADYCGRDALACYLLYQKYYESTKDHPIYRLERAIFPEVVKLRRNGVLIDRSFWNQENGQIEQEMENLQKIIEGEVSKKVGRPVSFNINSHQQLANVLYDDLKFPCKRYTTSGGRKTDKDTLNTLRWKSPIVRNIITYKELAKRKNTYYIKYQNFIEKDGRIHASWNQSGASTGRFSCSDPNLQNPPVHKSWIIEREEGNYEIEANLRKGLIVPEGSWMLNFDYSQIEARIAAGVTREPVLLNAFQEGIDYHTKTASLIYGVPVSTVTKEQRFMGKKLNFALSYGMGVDKLYHTLREEVNISYEQAKLFRKRYMEAYQTMFHEAKAIAKIAEKQGYIETIWGRRIPARPDKTQDAYTFHGTYNYRIQGSAGDLLKYAIFKTGEYNNLNHSLDEVKWILTIHDSLTYEVKESVNLVKFITDILRIMYYYQKNFPPFVAEVGMGRSLGDLIEREKNEGISDFVQRVLISYKSKQVQKDSKVFILEIESGEGRKPEQLKKLKDLIKENPGEHQLILKIGEIEKIIGNVSLDAKDRETVLFIMGGKYYERI